MPKENENLWPVICQLGLSTSSCSVLQKSVNPTSLVFLPPICTLIGAKYPSRCLNSLSCWSGNNILGIKTLACGLNISVILDSTSLVDLQAFVFISYICYMLRLLKELLDFFSRVMIVKIKEEGISVIELYSDMWQPIVKYFLCGVW